MYKSGDIVCIRDYIYAVELMYYTKNQLTGKMEWSAACTKTGDYMENITDHEILGLKK